MIYLDNSTRSLQIQLALAKTTADDAWSVSYEDVSLVNSPQGSYTGQAVTPGSANGLTNGLTAVTVVPAPSGVGIVRRLKSFQLYNVDTGSITVQFLYNDNATVRKVLTLTLATGESCTYEDGVGFQVFTAAGARK
jgi:hypothetical protein